MNRVATRHIRTVERAPEARSERDKDSEQVSSLAQSTGERKRQYRSSSSGKTEETNLFNKYRFNVTRVSKARWRSRRQLVAELSSTSTSASAQDVLFNDI